MSTRKADLCFYVRHKEMGSESNARNIFSKKDFRKNVGCQTKSKSFEKLYGSQNYKI